MGLSLFVLPKTISDHCPIILEGGRIKKGKTPFKFENMWFKVDGFKDLLRNWWTRYNVSGTSSLPCCEVKGPQKRP